MPASRSPAQQTTSRANRTRTRSHGPTTATGKAGSAGNGTKHGLRGDPFARLPDEDREAFAELHAAVTSDWGPRDAYERRWVMELVAAMWRQDRLRCLELATLTAAAAESPPTEATMRKLTTFARYGARIDRDIGRALQALRVLRNRPDSWIDELHNDTSEPDASGLQDQSRTNRLSPCTPEPEIGMPRGANGTFEPAARTCEPKPANANVESCSSESEWPALNRHERRRLDALARKRRAA